MVQQYSARWLVGGAAVAVLTVVLVAVFGAPEGGREGMSVTAVVPYAEAAEAIDFDRVRAHIAALSAMGSRIVGREGYTRALDYVCRQFMEIGLHNIADETVEVITPVDGETSLSLVSGESVPLYPLWPNAARTCQTPPEGISGPLVFGAQSRASDFKGIPLDGRIVVLDWRTGSEWQLGPSLGARAVIFLPNPHATRVHARTKYLSLPANIPRYYVPPEHTARVLEWSQRTPAVEATVRSTAHWKNEIAHSLIGVVPCGRVHDPSKPWEPAVLVSFFDSVSVVPALSPGAEQACGVAVLLELARYFVQHPLEDRDLVIFASGAHTPAMAGMKEFIRRHCLTEGPNGEPPWKPWIVTSLDLSTGTTRLAACHIGGFSGEFFFHVQPWVSSFGVRIDRYAKQIGAALGHDPDTILVDAINPRRGRNLWVYFPYVPSFQSELATLAGIPGLGISTSDDARLRIDTPDDTFAHLNLANLEIQTRTLAALLPNLFRHEGKVAVRDLPNFFCTLQGRAVTLDPNTSYIPDKPLPGAIIEAKTFTSPKWQVGLRASPMTITNASGEFRIDGMTSIATHGLLGRPLVEGSVVDATTGNIVFSNDYSSTRINDYPSTVNIDEPVKNLSVVLFPCDSVTLFGMSDPLTFLRLFKVEVFDAGTNSPPYQYGRSYPNAFDGDREEAAVVIYAERNTPLRLAMGVGPLQNRLVLLNANETNPYGTGFDLTRLATIRSLFFQGAWDLWHLNEDRLKTFLNVGVSPHRVLGLHRESRTYLEKASQALERLDYDDFIRESYRGWSLEARAYPEILTIANDMIHGVIFYLFLLLPFAYCFERLVIAASTITGRLTGIFATFLTGFVVLMLVHPAFRLTITPLLVLLAFVILALSVAVIAILVGKFDRLMWQLRSAAGGLHESDVNRAGAATRAIDLGIANLRRRRQRTILTCSTLVLVTFTLLSFTSIVPELTLRSVPYKDGEAVYDGLLYRDRTWMPMPLEQYEALKREHAGKQTVVGRIWMFTELVGQESAIELFATTNRQRRCTVQALLGMEPEEVQFTKVDKALVAGRWFHPGEERAVILTERLAGILGLGPENLGHSVNIYGALMPLIGILNDKRFIEIHDLDGEPLTPVNHLLMAQRLQNQGPPDKSEFERYIHLLANDVAIVPFEFVKLMEPSVRSIAVRYDSGDQVVEALKELTRRTEQTVFASANGEVSVYSAINSLSLSATGGLFIPVAIGGLIVLASMLGAVFERRREIGVFNAVGLAPLHVSSLFLAEATVFALLGGIAGYLIGQVFARGLIWLDLLPGVTLNYSAASTIMVTAFSMLVALLSTIYPAIQAYRIAMPEDPAMRHRPQAEGDHLEVDLPFTATGDDAYGVNAYLHEFLSAHLEASVGDLSTENISIAQDRSSHSPVLFIRFRAWLVPFDLGVSQDAALRTWHDETSAGYRLTLTLRRNSGDQNAWQRTNRHFLTVLRKQFLIWRILSQQEKERYIARGKELFA